MALKSGALTQKENSSLPLFPELVETSYKKGELRGVVDAIYYYKAETGYVQARVNIEKNCDPGIADYKNIVIIGSGDPFMVGDYVVAEGSIEPDARHKRVFRAKHIQAKIPENTDGIIRYLIDRVEGIGKKAANQLERRFGGDLHKYMHLPTTLADAGITKKQADAISEHWEKRTRYGQLLTVLYGCNIGSSTTDKIIEKYGEKSLHMVLSKPYQLTQEIKGIGFKIADKIALSQGLAQNDPSRIDAALKHQLQFYGREGHCAMEKERLVSDIIKILGKVKKKEVEDRIDHGKVSGWLVEEQASGRKAIFEKSTRECEIEVSEQLISRISPVDLSVEINDEFVGRRTAEIELPPLHINQTESVIAGLTNKVSIVTGPPGTGKTSCVRVLMHALERLNPDEEIVLAAPTGRAAKRMMESTGKESSTVHRLLEWSPEKRGFVRCKENPVKCDTIIIDEYSMVDIWLARDLLRALEESTRIIFVGDVDQLPSVGPGNVLGDMISSGAIPVTRLTHIFRQGDGSNIATASRSVNSGKMPGTTKPAKSSDMWGIFVEDNEEAVQNMKENFGSRAKIEADFVLEKLRKLTAEIAPSLGYDPLKDVQVLAPGHNSETGTVSLNENLQNWVNPARPGIDEIHLKDNRVLRVGDRVIQVVNNYDLDVYNGDIGNVTGVLDQPGGIKTVSVNFDGKEVVYTKKEIDELSLAYCISIHKSQGSEFPLAICVVTGQHWIMLRRNLVYTAISRAKSLCGIIGSKRALMQSSRNTGGIRLTGLAKRLSDANAMNILSSIDNESEYI